MPVHRFPVVPHFNTTYFSINFIAGLEGAGKCRVFANHDRDALPLWEFATVIQLHTVVVGEYVLRMVR